MASGVGALGLGTSLAGGMLSAFGANAVHDPGVIRWIVKHRSIDYAVGKYKYVVDCVE